MCILACSCVKPNPESRPGSLQPEYVLEQLRAGGVLEAVRIACAGQLKTLRHAKLAAAYRCCMCWTSSLSHRYICCRFVRNMFCPAGCSLIEPNPCPPPAGFPTRKPFRPFAQRYALLLPEAPANARQRPTSPGGGSNGALALPLTRTGFVDWFALTDAQVRGTGEPGWRFACMQASDALPLERWGLCSTAAWNSQCAWAL